MISGSPSVQIRDVVVIGGGPAGSVAGAYLARAGFSPLILEKEYFPRFAIGESLLPFGNGILKELDIWPELERCGFLRKYGADFCTGDAEHLNRYWFREALGTEHEQAFQVERSQFDKILLDRARTEGCEVIEGARVATLEKQGTERVRIDYEDGTGRHTLEARWVIDASGRPGLAGTLLKIPKLPTRDRKMLAIYGHFSNMRRDSGEAGGHTVIVRFKGDWFWLIPFAGSTTSVGAVLPPAVLREYGGDLDKTFRSCVAENPDVAARMVDAEPIMPLRATADYSWRFESFADGRVILTGDAAGFVDPIFSSGVMLAMKSSQLAVELIKRADALDRGLTRREARTYTRDIVGWMRLYSRIIGLFYSPNGYEIFMHPMPFLNIPKAIGAIVGGNLALPFSQRWRLAVFDLICLLQKFLKLAPTIPSLR